MRVISKNIFRQNHPKNPLCHLCRFSIRPLSNAGNSPGIVIREPHTNKLWGRASQKLLDCKTQEWHSKSVTNSLDAACCREVWRWHPRAKVQSGTQWLVMVRVSLWSRLGFFGAEEALGERFAGLLSGLVPRSTNLDRDIVRWSNLSATDWIGVRYSEDIPLPPVQSGPVCYIIFLEEYSDDHITALEYHIDYG